MSEEEKKAVEILKKLSKEYEKLDYRFGNMLEFEQTNAIYMVLKLIENQQKEIEELKQQNFNFVQEKMINKNSTQPLSNFYDYYDVIPKTKIEEKIEDLKTNNNGDDYSVINVINILKDLKGE